MTDRDLIAKKLRYIEEQLKDLRRLRPEAIPTDEMVEAFAERRLQVAIQAALDVASHVVSDQVLGEPRRNRDMFELLGKHGWLPAELVERLVRMVGFRNILVHGYEIVDPARVRAIVEDNLGDLDQFVLCIRDRVGP